MNTVTVCGPVMSPPYFGHTTCGMQCASLYLQIPSPCPRDGPGERIPCVFPPSLIPEILRWYQQGFRVRVEGHLRCETIWYDEGHGIRTVQVFAERVTAVDPTASSSNSPSEVPR